MPSVNPYLIFDGNCAEAMRFYERVLGGKLERMMTFGRNAGRPEGPPNMATSHRACAPGRQGGVLMASDTDAQPLRTKASRAVPFR
jgi:PhnB protein